MDYKPNSFYQTALLKDYQLRYGQRKGKKLALKEIYRIGVFFNDLKWKDYLNINKKYKSHRL